MPPPTEPDIRPLPRHPRNLGTAHQHPTRTNQHLGQMGSSPALYSTTSLKPQPTPYHPTPTYPNTTIRPHDTTQPAPTPTPNPFHTSRTNTPSPPPFSPSPKLFTSLSQDPSFDSPAPSLQPSPQPPHSTHHTPPLEPPPPLTTSVHSLVSPQSDPTDNAQHHMPPPTEPDIRPLPRHPRNLGTAHQNPTRTNQHLDQMGSSPGPAKLSTAQLNCCH
ncbi:hypothetical protein Pcinc_010139 [Petrolisthes cinctipes]|uniref:Uncharacterized protein n=1 Tax=Petrolisthes cinctipes TaxID=88211 RepID=A0AAE1KVM5_PETCI|nr:hypothetical protein Pcinc_010139 [Petrolisthes cinctipes]